MQLPYEIISLVFTFLPERDLDNVQLVCRLWKDIANDRVWKEQFFSKYGTNEISHVSRRTGIWRKELLLRNEILRKWKKCSKDKDITINSTLIDNTNIFCSFGSDSPRAICFNTHKGVGNIIELDRGKIRRKLNASKYRNETLPVSAVDASRFEMVYGFLDGTVTTLSFSRDGGIATDLTDLAYRHDSTVSAVWVAKSRSCSKFIKNAVNVAAGSFTGVISLYNATGHHVYQPERSPVVMIEGTMDGSNAVNDGDILLVLYENGALYEITATGDEKLSAFDIKLLARIPTATQSFAIAGQLHLSNNCAVVQSAGGIHVIDLLSGSLVVMDLPNGSEITAFAIDKSPIPGTKYFAAGLSNNQVWAWGIPPVGSAENQYEEPPKIEVVRRKMPTSLESDTDTTEIPPPTTDGASASSPSTSEPRHIKSKPLWRIPNPIGFEHRLVQTEKPQITELAMNSAVVLVAGYNGLVMAVDLLSGKPLKRVNSRIPKNVLDFSRYSRDGLVPVTHVEIDPDPSHLRCLIAVRPAIQFVDLGSIELATKNAAQRKRRTKSKQRGPKFQTPLRYDVAEAIDTENELAAIDSAEDDRNQALMEQYGAEGWDYDEQLQFAMALSLDHGSQPDLADEQYQFRDGEDYIPDDELYVTEDPEEDQDLLRALELSAIETSANTSVLASSNAQAADESLVYADDDDEDLRRAIELSLQIA